MSVNNHFNAAYTKVTIYSPNGEPHECTRLNAIDLIRTAGYSWKQPVEGATDEAAVEEVEPVEEAAVEPEAPAEEAPAEEAPELDHINDPLSEIAAAITGNADVEKYLEGFTADALRTMAEERYGQKIHHKASKETAVSKIVDMENEKIASEMDD